MMFLLVERKFYIERPNRVTMSVDPDQLVAHIPYSCLFTFLAGHAAGEGVAYLKSVCAWLSTPLMASNSIATAAMVDGHDNDDCWRTMQLWSICFCGSYHRRECLSLLLMFMSQTL